MSLCMSVTSIVGGEFFLALTATKLEFWMFFFHMNVHPKLCEDCLVTNGTHNSFHFLYSFLGGLSLHLNHLIASRTANYDWPFGTLPFGLFGSNLDTRDLETYPRTYSGHF